MNIFVAELRRAIWLMNLCYFLDGRYETTMLLSGIVEIAVVLNKNILPT
jgi:hypothetical protein